jgi:myo-inositol-1(or 4)-monophosphatase
MDDLARRAEVAERAARAGGALAMESFRTDIAVETKEGKTDVVTQADRDAQERAIETIREAFPDDAVVGEEEEALKEVPEEGPAWVIDPIDGTDNFVRGIPIWGTSVASVIDGEPVAATNAMPAVGDYYVADNEEARLNGEPISVSQRADPEVCTVAPTLWWDFDHREQYASAVRAIVERFGDMRRFGCAQGTLNMVADGGLDGTMSDVRPNPWDTVAGVHLVRRAGGRATDLRGERWRHDSEGLVVSNGIVHETVLEAVRSVRR